MPELNVCLDVLFLFMYIFIAVVVGWYNSRDRIISLSEYAVGYTSISTPVLICGIIATGIGAGTVVGEVGKLFAFGLPFAATQFSRIISYIIASKIFPKNLPLFKGCLSISHVMHRLYGNSARLTTTALALPMALGMITVQMIAVGMILSNLLHLQYNPSLILSFLMVTIFSLIGGIRTITQVGVFQFALFFLVLPISCAWVSANSGGYAELGAHLPILDWGLDGTNVEVLLTLFLSGILPDCSSAFIQKCLIARNEKQLKDSLVMVAKIHIPIILSLCFVAYVVRVLNPEIDPDQAMFYYVNYIAPALLKGAISVGLIAIIMGMSDGILHATSTIVANDIVKVLRPNAPEKTLLHWARGAIVLLCVAALSLASFIEDVFSIIYAIYSLWHLIIMVPLCAGFLGFKTAPRTFLISTAVAICFVMMGYGLGLFPAMIVMFGIVGSFIGFFIGHLVLRLYNAHISFVKCYSILLDLRLNWRKKLIISITKLKNALEGLIIFPKESQMELGQRQMYHKFCVSMMFFFFVYVMTMGKGKHYDVLVVLISLGYVMNAVIMIRNVLFKGVSEGRDNNYLQCLWYCSLVMLPTVASYALLSRQSNSDMVLMNAVLSLIALGLFTNTMSFIICLFIGFIMGAGIYHYCFDLWTLDGGTISVFLYAWAATSVIGLYFLWARELAVNEEIGRIHMVSGSMAHEVKTPMAVNYTYAATAHSIFSGGKVKELKRGRVAVQFPKQEYEDLNEFMSKMVELSAAGAKTVDMLLITMKKNMQGVKMVQFNLLDSVHEGVNGYVASHSGARDRIEIKVRKTFKVVGAKDYMTNVIQNLVKNAFNHGGRSVQVKIYSKKNQLIVEDNGRGISADVLPLIFGRFYTKSEGGTGLGLAFTKMVVKDMGGTVICESEEGKYTRFIITLPTRNSL